VSRLPLLGAVALAGCLATQASEETQDVSQGATPIDRLLIGQAARYPAEAGLRARLAEFNGSMEARRQLGWEIARKALTPTPLAAGHSLPRFQTWYSRDDFLPMFDRLFRALPDEDKRARAPFSDRDIAGVFPWDARMAPTLPSFTKERLLARLRDMQSAPTRHSLGGDDRALLSPAYVAHVLRNYRAITSCVVPAPDAAPPSDTNFAPCLGDEFPADAAAIKARWIPDSLPFPAYDTSPAGLASSLARGSFADHGDITRDPAANEIYTMEIDGGTSLRLAALHIATKELREWAWVTLWWSDAPDEDFGADRPESIRRLGEPWSHYKMCIVTGFREDDHALGARYGEPTWCANPYLELGDHNATTNCIGCHQHGGTAETTRSILDSPSRFPETSRTRTRDNFPLDYTYAQTAGLELSAAMKNTIEALTPP
jgi:hypothetical protein